MQKKAFYLENASELEFAMSYTQQKNLFISGILALTFALVSVTSAHALNKTQKGALIGASVGGLIGDGKGAVAGGIAGAIIGKNS